MVYLLKCYLIFPGLLKMSEADGVIIDDMMRKDSFCQDFECYFALLIIIVDTLLVGNNKYISHSVTTRFNRAAYSYFLFHANIFVIKKSKIRFGCF